MQAEGDLVLRQKQLLLEKIEESMAAVLPITAIVLIISITIAPLTPGTLCSSSSGRCCWCSAWACSPWGWICP